MAKKPTPINKEFLKGLWDSNPVFVGLLGLCPALAVTVSAENGIAMALATTFVLTFSSLIVSLIKNIIPTQVRIASFIVIIATFVTIVDIVMKAQFPEISKSLGPYIPLIVVNCLILGRQEAFSSKNTPLRSVIDALGMGLGFMIALGSLGGIREILGSRELLGFQVLPEMFEPWIIMILPAGAFLTLGFMLAGINQMSARKKAKKTQSIVAQYWAKKEHLQERNLQVIQAREELAEEAKAKAAEEKKRKAEEKKKADEAKKAKEAAEAKIEKDTSNDEKKEVKNQLTDEEKAKQREERKKAAEERRKQKQADKDKNNENPENKE
jgi:electron transport complex protein RnfE